jgi:hypothetical protein
MKARSRAIDFIVPVVTRATVQDLVERPFDRMRLAADRTRAIPLEAISSGAIGV